jgi:N-acetylmuramoyl-L-alanine amidase
MKRTQATGLIIAIVTVFTMAATGADVPGDPGHPGHGVQQAASDPALLMHVLGPELAPELTGDRVSPDGEVAAGDQDGVHAAGPLVVIDPGHGGTNTGAPGFEAGFYEKQLTLVLSRDLAWRLEQMGYRVALTRDRDVYLTLRQRVRQANQLGADLFVSVHANATETHAQRGYETFILTPRAVDVDGRALRARDGAPRAQLDASTALVLDDLERGAVQPMAADLAAAIQARLREVRGAEGDRGVRQDAMHVLLGATMPAVLVEVGFVDHTVEGRELRDPAVQAQITTALARAIAATLPPR